MKKTISILLTVLIILCLSSCKNSKSNSVLNINVICKSKDIYSILYTVYIDNENYSIGTLKDKSNKEITETTNLKITFDREYFKEREQFNSFSIDFTPYKKGQTSSNLSTNKLKILIEYGINITIEISGNDEIGYSSKIVK